MTTWLPTGGPTWRLTQLQEAATRAAQRLRMLGVTDRDRVLLKADNSVEWVVSVLALIHAGASIVLLDHQQTAAESRAVAVSADVQWMLIDGDEDVNSTVYEVPDPSRRIAVGWLGGVLDGHDGRPEPFNWDRWASRDDALITWSSGSTNKPKGIVKSGRAWLDNLERTRLRMGYRADDVFLPLLPFSHQYGLSIVLLACLSSAALSIVPYRRLDSALRTAHASGATVIDATPAMYRTMLKLFERRPRMLHPFGAVRLCCTGGAPMEGGLPQRFEAATGLPLLDGYGSTEAGNVSFATPDNPVACGRPLPGVRVQIVGADGAVLPVGEVGEIQLETTDLATGYLHRDGQIMRLGDGWFATHDLGYLDDAGNLRVLGRRNAVHRKGYTLYPEALERKAEACGRSVKVVPVAGESDAQLVFFVEDPDGRNTRYWRQRIVSLLPPSEQPNQLHVLATFPLGRTGKVDAHRLMSLVTPTSGRA